MFAVCGPFIGLMLLFREWRSGVLGLWLVDDDSDHGVYRRIRGTLSSVHNSIQSIAHDALKKDVEQQNETTHDASNVK